MHPRHWFRLLALLLYVAGVLFVLHQCSRQFNPPEPPTPKTRPAPVPDIIARQQQQRAARQAEHQEQLQKRKAAYEALEADLKILREVDLPLAMAELSREALRYQNKISDLARLELAARWEREEPVKKARDRAYRLVLEYQRLDQEAQKEREGPTVYKDDDVALLTKRLGEFIKGGEGVAAFAAAVPAFAGQVPEKLLFDSIDAMAVAALPADAFDPCRNPLACPKEAADKPSTPAPAAPKEKLRFVSPWARHHELIVRIEPNSREPNAGILSAGQPVPVTGRKSEEFVPNGLPIRWLEIDYHGSKRWALEKIFRKEDPDDARYDPWNFRSQPIPKPSRRSRKPDFFSGMFGN